MAMFYSPPTLTEKGSRRRRLTFMTKLNRINYLVNLVNWHFFGINYAILNKIRRVVFEYWKLRFPVWQSASL